MFDPDGSKDRCLLGRLCVRRLDKAAALFGRRMTRESTCWKRTGESFTPYVFFPQ